MEGVRIEPINQSTLDDMQQQLEEIGCHTRQSSHHHSEYEQHLSLGQPLCDVEKPTVDLLSVGGLYVIGTVNHNERKAENGKRKTKHKPEHTKIVNGGGNFARCAVLESAAY